MSEEKNPNSFIYETPIEKTMVYQIKSCVFQVNEMVVNTSCLVIVSCLTEEGNVVRNVALKLEGDDYQAWGNNDDYLIDWIKNKIIELP